QQRLLGLTNVALRNLARLPDECAPPQAEAEAAAAQPLPESRVAFWSVAPAPVIANLETAQGTDTQAAMKSQGDAPALLQGLRLGEDVTLLFEALRPIYEDDL